MIYIISGEEQIFIKDKINEICKDKDAEIIRFDGQDKEFDILEMLDSCNGNSLFSSKSIILVDQPFFLIKKCEDKDFKELEKYINDPVYDTELVFFTYENNFNNKLKCYKMISSNAQIISYNSLDYKNFNNYVRSRIAEEKLKMNNETINQLTFMCKRNATLLNSNLEILKLYPDTITNEAISKLCTASDDNDSFEMINALTNKDISKTIAIERKLLNENDSILSVIGLLANQLRFLYQISYLSGIGKKKKEIIEETGISEYRYTKAIETLNKLNGKQIIELLSELSALDIRSKSNNALSDSSSFELFILSLLRK